MSINFKYKICWKQIVLIAGLIISISVTMLYAATTNKNIELKYDADKSLSGYSPEIILTSKNGKQLILQKLNQEDSVISNTDFTNGRICFKTSGSVHNYICFVTGTNNIAMLEWQGLQGGDKVLFSTQPAIRIELSTGKMQYRDQGEEDKWHSFGNIANVAIDHSLGNKDQTLLKNRIIFMNEKSLTFDEKEDGTGNSIIIDSSGNIIASGQTTLNDITLNSSLKITDDENNYIIIEPPVNIVENYTMTLPKDIGNSGEVLVNDGNGKTFWQAAETDTSISDTNQTLDALRTVNMNGNNLTFHGEKDIIINANGDFDIQGNATLKGNLQVTEAVIFKNNLYVDDNVANVTINGSTTLGSDTSDTVNINGFLSIANNSAGNHIIIKAIADTQDQILVLPKDNGQPSQVLQNDGKGITSWVYNAIDTNLGNDDQILDQTRTINMSENTLTFDGVRDIVIDANGNINISGSTKIGDTFEVTGATLLEDELEVDGPSLFNSTLDISGNTIIGGTLQITDTANFNNTLNVKGNITINGSTMLGDNNDDITTINGPLKIVDDANHFVIIESPNTSTNYTFVLPPDNGESGQVLLNNGSGVTSWGSARTDTNISNTDQNLEESRTIHMNEKILTFDGTKDIIIDGSGNIDIHGTTNINNMLDVSGSGILQKDINVAENVTIAGNTVLGNTNNAIATIHGEIRLVNTNNNFAGINLPSSVPNYTIILPKDTGEKDQVLSINNRQLFWKSSKSSTNLGNNDQNLSGLRKVIMNGYDLSFNGTKDIIINGSGNIDIGGNTIIDNKLEVVGQTFLNDQLTVNDATLLDTILNVEGDAILEGTLKVTGPAIFKDTFNVNNDVTIGGNTTIGDDTVVTGSLRIANDNKHIIVKPQYSNQSYTLTLPSNEGEPSQVLASDGAGNTFWRFMTPDTNLGTDDQILEKLRTIKMNGNRIIFNGIEDIIIYDNGNINIGGTGTIENSLKVAETTLLSDELEVDGITSLDNNLNVSGDTIIEGALQVTGVTDFKDNLYVADNVTINGETTLGLDSNTSDIITVKGSLNLSDAGSNYITIKAPTSITRDYTITLPRNSGEPNETLSIDSNGEMYWFASAGDSNLGNKDQILKNARIVSMNRNNLIFKGRAEDIIIYDNGDLDISGDTNISGTLEISGVTNLQNALIVDRETIFNDNLDVTGDTTMGGTLEVIGISTLDNTLYIHNNVTINGSTTLGDNNDITRINGILKLADDNTHYITIESPDVISDNYTFTLPKDSGKSGQFLASDGAGVTTWTDAGNDSNLGNENQLLENDRIVTMNGNNLIFKDRAEDIIISDNGDLDISGDTDLRGVFEVTGPANLNNTLTVAQTSLLNDTLDVLGNTTIEKTLQVTGVVRLDDILNVEDNVTINGFTNLGDYNDTTIINGLLKINDAGGYIIIQSPDSISEPYTLTLPSDGGNPNEVLITDGNGVTSWSYDLNDTYLGTNEQTLEEDRTVIMNGNNLTFEGTKNIVIYDNGGINIEGSGTIGWDFEVIKETVLNDTLTVNEITSLNTNLDVAGNSTMEGTLEVTGAASLDSTLNVGNNVTIDGSTNLGNDNNDVTTINGFLELADDDASNYITIKSPDSLINSYMFVLPKDKPISNQALVVDDNGGTKWGSGQISTSLASADQTLLEDRTVDMSGNNLTFQGTAENIIISNDGALDISGNTDVKGNLEVIGTTILQDTLTVEGAAILNNNLNVTKDTSIGGTLKVIKAANIGTTLNVNNNVTINGSTVLGNDNSDEAIIKGSLNIINNTNNAITIKSPDSLVNSYTFVLPPGPGNSGEKLVIDSNGITNWVSEAGETNLGNSDQSLTENRTVNMAGNNLTFQGTVGNIIIYDNGNINISGSGTIGDSFEVTGATILQDALTVQGAATLNNNLNVTEDTSIGGVLQVAGVVTLDDTLDVMEDATINGSTTLGNENTDVARINGSLKIADNSDNKYITIKPSNSMTNNYTLVLPSNIGEPNQLLSTDGNEITSWISPRADTSLASDNQKLEKDRKIIVNGNNLIFKGTKDVIINENLDLNIGGDAVFKGGFEVTGTTTLGNELIVVKTTSINNKLDVLGDTSLEGSLNVTKNAIIENNLNVLGDLTINGIATLGNDTGDEVIIKGSLDLVNNTDNYITIKSSDSIIDNYTLVLPATYGDPNRLFTSDGNGVISWGLPAIDTNLGNYEQTLDKDRLVITNGNNLIFEGTTKNIIYNNSNIDIDGNGIIKGDFQVQGITALDDQLTVKNPTLLNDILNVTEDTNIESTLKVLGAAILDNTLDVTENITIDGLTTLGNENTDVTRIKGSLDILNNAGNHIKIKSPDSITPYTFVLPENDGEDTNILITNGNGVSSWQAPKPDTNLGNNEQTLTNTRIIQMDGNNLTFDGIEDIIIYNNGDIDIGGNSVVQGTFEVTEATTLNDELTVTNAVVFNDILVKNNTTIGGNLKVASNAILNTVDVNNNVTMNGSTTLGDAASDITSINGILKLGDNTLNNYITIKSPDSMTNNNIFILPDNDGEPNQTLYMNGTGEFFWLTFEDTKLENKNLIIDSDRKLDMQGHTLTFDGDGINDIVFNPNGNIDIQGERDTTISGTFTVKDNTNFADNPFTVNGTVNIGTQFNVKEDIIMDGTFETNNDFKIFNDLEVSGNIIVENTLNGSSSINSLLGNNPHNNTTIIKGLLRMADNDDNYITIKKSPNSPYKAFILPKDTGLPDQVLTYLAPDLISWEYIMDDHIGSSNQLLETDRIIDMNGHTLTFSGSGGKSVVINDTGDIEIGGDVTIGNSIDVTGIVSLAGELTVEGASIVQGELTIENNVLVEGDFTSGKSFDLSGPLEVGETLNLRKEASLDFTSNNLNNNMILKVPSDLEEDITFTLPSAKPAIDSVALFSSPKENGIAAINWSPPTNGTDKPPIGIPLNKRYHVDDCENLEIRQTIPHKTQFVEMYKVGSTPYGFCIETEVNGDPMPRHSRFWFIANRVCLTKNMRLPDYYEWRKACDGKFSGPEGTRFPYFDIGVAPFPNGEWVSSRPFVYFDPVKNTVGIYALIAGQASCDHIRWGLIRESGSFGISDMQQAGYRCVK